jgi:transposase
MRLGLIPTSHRAWTKKGVRPLCEYKTRYEWFYIYNIVFPFKYEQFTIFMPYVNLQTMNIFWREFAKKYGNEQQTIFYDNAGFHQEKYLNYDFLKIVRIPPYSPELNPAETIWKVYREFISNRTYDNLEELEKQAMIAFNYIENNKKEILKRTRFEWLIKYSRV